MHRLRTAIVVALSVALVVAAGLALAVATRHATRVAGPARDRESVTVRSAAQQWGTRAAVHFGARLDGRLRCSIPAGVVVRGHGSYAVSCRSRTRSHQVVRLVGAHAAIAADGDGQYLTGPWTLRVGASARRLPCLPARWSPARPCLRR